VIGAAAGVIVFAPAMALIAIAILIEDGGPVLFRQPRLGYRRVPFDILKFRSMRDGRITRVGRVLRATGLDEIPQLFNILRGEMSAVGPRPLTAADVDRLGWSGERFDFRWECAPGLTGLAQLLGMGAADAALAWDRVHAERWSPWLDCQLIAWSFVVNAFGKARTRRWIHRYAQRFAAEQFALAVAGRVNDNTPIRVEPPPSDNEPDGPQASAGRSRIEEGS
jgi:lipopolysaccharide/colanic/teichoic acid biosynthesis glycosyltransferase